MATINGTAGNDILKGTDGADTIFGLAGDDTIDGVLGADTLYGGSGNDLFRFSAVQVSSPAPTTKGLIDGGDGFDVVDISNISPTRLYVENGTNLNIAVGSQVFSTQGIERFLLGDSNSYVSIGSYTGQSTELVYGNTAKDITFTGNISLVTGSSNDTFFVGRSVGTKTLGSIAAGDGTDTLQTNIGFVVDLAAGTAKSDDAFYNLTGIDDIKLSAYYGQAAAYGNDQANKISVWYDAFSGGLGVELDGRGGNDTLSGTKDGDRLYGGSGNDSLNGLGGNDTLMGGSGNDALNGGVGNDFIDGGTGFDRAIYTETFLSYSATVTSGSLVLHGAAAEGVDTLSGVEAITFRDGTYVVDADSVGAQVMRLYDTVLQRGADPIGLDFSLDLIQDKGATLDTVASNLLNSPEFQTATGTLSNTAFVEYVYQQALGRGADAGGSSYWTSQLDGGLSRSSMLIGFSESAEHRALTSDLVGKGYFDTDDTYQAVALLYDSFTGRLPDTGGLTFWSEQVKTGGRTLTQVANEFAASSEFMSAIAGKDNGQLVDFMYQNTLDRGPDASGRAFWVSQLDAGLTKGALLLSFSQSAEHFGLKAADIIGGIKVAGGASGTAAVSPGQDYNLQNGPSLSSAAPASAFILENAAATSHDVAQAMWLDSGHYADASMPAYVDMAHVF